MQHLHLSFAVYNVKNIEILKRQKLDQHLILELIIAGVILKKTIQRTAKEDV